ncbi:PilW family protein [Billgrantia kenyensis]|uniref:Prepilin-type N-terminal cleavage/methylation domain-containing protein n=1 Tax=Billgrantia kenyensis TaxID=321266 RepID=A0A7V9W3U4_9GAMM|nr:prepilin-type N-terminal cleavage/methylation domain-containing protein [Halomonas kenyensis]MBA2780577.1 prepilin-type N-terminal cleavage/methylation domain-containing protein [Halomonas kenyensis]MCG6663270.1 prepilin-type N-terminal cleavage/methylation domain-containing protein [Halomonas kenyensis]
MKRKKNDYLCRRHTVAYRQAGFTLIELMVALVIGLVIILGAGQLFLMGFQTFRQIELLSNKQAALTFATETLIRDIRKSDSEEVVWNASNRTLKVAFDSSGGLDGCNEGERVERVYGLSSGSTSQEGYSLMHTQACDGEGEYTEPVVSSFARNGFSVNDAGRDEGVYILTFCLLAEPGDMECHSSSEFGFRAVNRSRAVTAP